MLQYIISIFLSIFKGFAKKKSKKHDKISGHFPFVFRTILHKQNFSKDLTNEGGCGIIIWCTAYDPLAQSVEHLTFNQGVRGSSLRWVTKNRRVSQERYPSVFGDPLLDRSLQVAGGGRVISLFQRNLTPSVARISSSPMGHQKQEYTAEQYPLCI